MEKYECLELLYSATQGQVWKIRDKTTKQLFAMKSSVNDPDIQTEYKNLKNLQYSSSICQIHDSFLLKQGFPPQEHFYLILTLYKQDLSTRIQSSKNIKTLTGKGPQQDELQILKWMNQLTNGILIMHKEKITHRDLKPANLFLDNEDHLVIGDFGISVQKTIALSIKGTAGYFAPEVLQGIGYTASADMWSVGCILLDLLTLQLAQDVVGIDKKKRIESIPSYYSVRWRSIVTALLMEDPITRMNALKLSTALLELQNQKLQEERKQKEEEELKKKIADEKKKNSTGQISGNQKYNKKENKKKRKN